MTTQAALRVSRNRPGIARLVAGLLAGVIVPFLCAADVHRRSLSFEERVAAQKTIEQVYWNHRMWPKENPAPKPALSAVLPDRTIRARVEDYLKKSDALETNWQRPITAKQLQAELDRMSTHTRAPQVLKDLFAALGNDPLLIAETLARQTLADRLVRNWYANDTRFHGELKRKAEAQLAACPSVGCMASLGGEYHETTWKLRSARGEAIERELPRDVVLLGAEEWQAHLARLAGTLGGVPEALPVLNMGRLEETAEGFVVTAVLLQGKDEIRTATVTWPKVSFDEWWEKEGATLLPRVEDRPQLFTLPTTGSTGCEPDTWSPTFQPLPAARYGAAAVWTGTEMIVWGGADGSHLNTGVRYDPSTDSWTPTSTGANVPEARSGHTAVWTGTEMIVWGGGGDNGALNTGGRYDPATDTWTPTSTDANVPTPRGSHTAVWTGTEMIVWGGGYFLNTGGRYDPSTDTWTPTSLGANVPAASLNQTAVWTGTEMIIWGGSDGSGVFLNTGGRYDPSADTWMPTSTGTNVPDGRHGQTAVWTGTEMIVWGGYGDNGSLNTGSRYDPSTDTWSPTSMGANVPEGRYDHRAVWTGTEMISWGGSGDNSHLNTGGRYDPSTDMWTPISAGANAPEARAGLSAVWTGTEMIVWGGYGDNGPLNTGGRYDPSTDTWVPTSAEANVPAPRELHTAVWTGTEMIVWAGLGGGYLNLNTGARYNPSTDTWTPTSTGANVPDGRYVHTAVWTGTGMIVWGGYGDNGPLNTGGRYDPSTDAWTPTSAGANVPAARVLHTTVWTGTEMIVWGGRGDNGPLNTGSRYDPSADAWTPTSTGSNVPEGRIGQTAVWTGTEMIVWGGMNGASAPGNTGGRYAPSTDTWTPTSTGTNVPEARAGHTAVWTGRKMIVWGGTSVDRCYLDDFGNSYCYSVELNSGGSYDPSTDIWTPTSTGPNLPEGRGYHTAVWTGTQMIIWGGVGDIYYLDTGGRFDPSTDTWRPTSAGANAPGPRVDHSAVWTGMEMIVWGGFGASFDRMNSGGRYCACPDQQDSDSDGIGDACDNCPFVSNLTQDPLVCECFDVDLGIRFKSPLGRSSGLVSWTSCPEVDLVGFNLVSYDSKGNRARLNSALIPCEECITGLRHAYYFTIPKHKSGRDLFLEVLHLSGSVSLFGPAVKQEELEDDRQSERHEEKRGGAGLEP